MDRYWIENQLKCWSKLAYFSIYGKEDVNFGVDVISNLFEQGSISHV